MAESELTRAPAHPVHVTFSEGAIAKLSLTLFALIIVGLAVIILSVVAGDAEIITRLLGKRISAAALALAAISGVVLIIVSLFAAVGNKRPVR
jgi:hypothetical protein